MIIYERVFFMKTPTKHGKRGLKMQVRPLLAELCLAFVWTLRCLVIYIDPNYPPNEDIVL